MPKHRVLRHEVVQPQDQSYKIIPLTRGQNTLVNIEGFAWLNQWNWYAKESTTVENSFYAARMEIIKNKRVLIDMARELLDCGPNEEADHRDRNTLNNQRNNLRKATRLQNARNQGIRQDNTSGFKGVSFHKERGKWQAQINCTYLGLFPTPKEAARAYNEAAKRIHGEFAVLNFID